MTTTKTNDIEAKVIAIVCEQLDVRAEDVAPSKTFTEDLGADSLAIVELVLAFEEAFNCEIPDDAAETILTVGDAIKFLESAKTA